MQKRTIVATSILLVGVGLAFWIMSGSQTNAGNVDISVSPANGGDARFYNGSSTDPNAQENITDDVVREYGGEILKLNPQGQGLDKPLTLPSDDTLNNIITKATQKPIPVSEFSDKDITITNTTSKDAARAYLKALSSAEQENTILYSNYYPTISSYVVTGNSQDLDALIAEISTHINVLLSIPVPSNWKDFHLDLINLWQHKLVYTKALLTKEDDPIRSASATQSLQALLDQENNLRTAFSILLKNANL